jgi:hypothetical protein
MAAGMQSLSLKKFLPHGQINEERIATLKELKKLAICIG